MIRNPRTRVLGGLVLVLAPVLYVVAEAVAATAWTRPRYSYAENYVSDLGVTGQRETFLGHDIYSPLAPVMNVGFIADGVLALLAAILIIRFRAGRRAKAIWILSILVAVGLVLVGVVHGSQLSQQAGTIGLHFLGAPVAIVAGVVGIAALAAELVVMGGVPSFPAGVCERVSVYAVLASQLVLGLGVIGGQHAVSELSQSPYGPRT